jgi:hypothetical protein
MIDIASRITLFEARQDHGQRTGERTMNVGNYLYLCGKIRALSITAGAGIDAAMPAFGDLKGRYGA